MATCLVDFFGENVPTLIFYNIQIKRLWFTKPLRVIVSQPISINLVLVLFFEIVLEYFLLTSSFK